MYRDFEIKSVYDTLPMQAALRLYLPHTDNYCNCPAIELSAKPMPLEQYIAPGKIGKIIHRIFKGKDK